MNKKQIKSEVVSVEIAPPDHIKNSSEAMVIWNRLVGFLNQDKLISNVDSDAISLYVDTYMLYQTARRGLVDNDIVIVTNNGFARVSPYVSIVKETTKSLSGMLIEFGMTPASRRKFTKAEESNPEEDAFNQLLMK